tara:strand:- start:1255 stop:2313 length:1059 start_codon:yes stop_codon:yes gene_type:complete
MKKIKLTALGNKKVTCSEQDAMQNKKFLFILGMPRSGTKLIRNILNGSDDIYIPDVETEMLDSWYSRYKNKTFEVFDEFNAFYQYTISMSFFSHQRNRGRKVITVDEWYKLSAPTYDLEAIFRALIMFDLSLANDLNCNPIYLGDKSPSYINSVDAINSVFSTEFDIILIIRDPRDYCLSSKKAWGKNIYRSAQRWHDSMAKCNASLKRHRGRVCKISFEELTSQPAKVVQSLCLFLGIDYCESMLEFSTSPENIGDAKGSLTVINNSNKWCGEFTNKEIKKIEKICGNLMVENGYKTSFYNGKGYRIPKVMMFYYKIFDGINLIFKRSTNVRTAYASFLYNVKYAIQRSLR